MTMSMFPDVPDDEVIVRTAESPLVIRRTRSWKLLRAGKGGPGWHRLRTPGMEGGWIAVCGHVGSLVSEDIADGTLITACPDCHS